MITATNATALAMLSASLAGLHMYTTTSAADVIESVRCSRRNNATEKHHAFMAEMKAHWLTFNAQKAGFAAALEKMKSMVDGLSPHDAETMKKFLTSQDLKVTQIDACIKEVLAAIDE